MNGLTPFSLVLSLVAPAFSWRAVNSAGGMALARSSLVVGALTAGAGYVFVVWAMHSATKKTFMFTVRKLAGTN